MPSIVFNEEQIINFYNKYQNYLANNTNEYIRYFFKIEGNSVSIFYSGKTVFQGSNLEIFSEYIDIENIIKIDYDSYNSIGSDEVGTGDFFGPIVTCSAYVPKTEVEYLKGLGIKDSKKISDDKIIELSNILKTKLVYKVNIITNELYNKVISNNNLNVIKAILHNDNMIHLSKIVNYDYAILDEFVSQKLYFEYLKGKPIFQDVCFEMKGESKSIAVACASIIARSIFLEEIQKLSNKYGYILPLGSSHIVNEMIDKIKKDGNEHIFNHIAKTNFKNYK